MLHGRRVLDPIVQKSSPRARSYDGQTLDVTMPSVRKQLSLAEKNIVFFPRCSGVTLYHSRA
jgi:hypothetical protein